jgi:WD40 repeat protein
MVPFSNDDYDDEFAALLGAYDDALAQGYTPAPRDTPLDPELRRRLADAQEFLSLLESEWPRVSPDTINQPADVTLVSNWATAPTKIGRFEVRRELGRGGNGVVFLAYDPPLRREVALKLPRPEALVTEDLRLRFRREAEAAARLEHPNLVPIHEAGQDGPLSYLVMAYSPGPTLAVWLRHQTAPVQPLDAARLVERLADAVAYMHGQGVLHRDIKPGNILLVQAAPGDNPLGPLDMKLENLSPRLTDFGLAKLTEGASQYTRTGTVLGTPAYMAPEQADGQLAAIGPCTDVYALGIVLYEMLTGRPPFQGASDLDTVRQLVTDEPVPPRQLRPEVPRDLNTICLRCLEKEPKRRYASAALLLADLRAFQAGEPILARPARMWERAAKWARRRPAVAALSTVAAAALFALLGWAIWYDVKLRQHTIDLQNALDRAEAGERRGREDNYTTQMKLADTMQGKDSSGLLVDLLNSFRPSPDQEDLRGFEWYYLWNVASRELHLRGHTRVVRAVAFSSDGTVCASGDEGGNVRLWAMRTGKSLGAWAGHKVGVTDMAFSRDGSQLTTAANNADRAEYVVWDVGTMKEIARFEKSSGGYFCRAIASEGNAIAFDEDEGGGEIRAFGILNPHTGQIKYLFRGLPRNIEASDFSPDGNTLVLAAWQDGIARFWDLSSGEERLFPLAHKADIKRLSYSPDAKFLASIDEEGLIKFWNLTTSQLHAIPDLKEPVHLVAFSPDGKVFAVATSGQKDRPETQALILCNWPKGDRRPEVLKPGFYIRDIAFSPDSQTIAVGGSDHQVRLWRPFAASRVSTLSPRGKAEAWSVAFSPDSQTLAVGYDDQTGPNRETLKLWDVRTGREIANLGGHSAMVSEVAFTPDGQMLASASFDRDVRLWDPNTHKLITTLKGAGDRLRCLAVSPDSRLLAAAGSEKQHVHIWDLSTGRKYLTLAGEDGMNRVAFAPDGKAIVAANFSGLLIFWDLATGKHIATLKDARDSIGMAYAPNGLNVATGNGDGIVKLWDPAGDGEPRSLIGHTDSLRAVAYSPDGKTLATGGHDRTVRLWQVSTGRELLVFKELPHQVNSLAFSPDGQHLAAATHDGSVRVWHAPRDD